MPYLSIEQIRSAPDIKEVDFEVPEWPDADGKPGVVKLRGLTVGERNTMIAKATVNGKLDDALLQGHLLRYGIAEPALTEEHLGLLSHRSIGVTRRLAQKIMELSGMTQEAAHNAEAAFPRQNGAEV